MSRRPTYFMVTVDTEEEWDWSGPFPTRDLQVTNLRTLPRFQDLCEKHGVSATYFTDLAVLENAESRPILLEVARRDGVEIGMHIHPWNTPPLAVDPPTPRSTFLHNLPPDVIRAKLTSVYEGFLGAGMRPTSFRGGRYSSGGVVHEFLQERGFVAECSVVPFTTWSDDGAPDYRTRDLTPNRIPPASPNGQAMWELPLTFGYSRRPFSVFRRCFEVIETSWLSKLRLIGVAEKLGLVRKVWLNFEIGDPYDWLPFLALLRKMDCRCICLTLHSSSLALGPGPYTRNEADQKRIFDQINRVFGDLCRLDGFIPATASQIAAHLEQEYACSRN